MKLDIENLLGVERAPIQLAYDLCEKKIRELRLSPETIEDINQYVRSHRESLLPADLTNSLIDIIFDAMLEIIEDKYPMLDMDYVINGMSSTIEYEHEETLGIINALQGVDDDVFHKCMDVIDDIQDMELSEKQFQEIVNAGELDAVLQVIENMNYFDLYDSVEEFGSDNNDNSEDGDSDYDYGMFLLNAYKQGNSNIYCHQFQDGHIIAGYLN